jgi:hypothetical protein
MAQTKRNERLRIALLALGAIFIVVALVFIFWAEGSGAMRVVTTGTAPDTTVTTYPGHTARGSDTLDIFLLGVGLVLLLTGAFYYRISKIGLPGGGEIDLTPAASAQLADQVKQQVGEDPQQFERAYHKAVATLSADYWGKVASPPKSRLERAAAAAKSDLDQESNAAG